MRLCSVRWCFRPGRFPVEGTIWHACRLHHPTSPMRAPTIERVHNDWEATHPGFQVISLDCETGTPVEKEDEDEDTFFGFSLPMKKDTMQPDEANEELLPEEIAEREFDEAVDETIAALYVEGERPRRCPRMLPKRCRARFPGHSHQRRSTIRT